MLLKASSEKIKRKMGLMANSTDLLVKQVHYKLVKAVMHQTEMSILTNI